MKKIIFSLCAASMFLMTSCSEKFDVAAPYKDITVVYGYLDMADTAHYIRIQKAFLDENKSAIDMARVADSSFYSNISVRIERYNSSGTNILIDSIHLNRVDLAQEGYTKEAGTFFNAPNYAYKFTNALDPRFIYRLKITNLVTGNVDSADAPVINNQLPVGSGGQGFKVDPVDESSLNIDGMNFFSVLPYRYYIIDASYVPTPNYNFNGETNPAKVAQAVIRFNWYDSNIVTKTLTPRYYDLDAGYIGLINSNIEYKIENRSLYNGLSSGMGTAPENVIRLLDRCDLTMYLSTSDYNNYRLAIQAQGNGLTASEIAPVYTNIKGANVLGLFTSRAKRSGKITINERTVDSLVASPLLSHTKLKGTIY
jgi:hypothetical protein